ncbi:hydrolase [Mesobacillus maritimus]|uniref:Hydrolase n=1 Tax=Mesobacillus maritimus TaxID=1643336 RepID=A0ABS7JZB2_9BACI|nr:hydrolase [Mesobacillus maritimus]MBY0095332.1 hydrolase [Mesobacillus maritimus]
MENRNFRLDTEWNMIHYPHRPNGFGILILGDERHFVDSQNSFWTQNEGKRKLLHDFKEAGYTIFYSNLFGMNWGSQNAVDLAARLCAHIRRSEILNDKIHVFAEGMGALTALKLLKREKRIRSLLLLNPVLSLNKHLEQEKEHKFFYKKLLQELAIAYQLEPKEVTKYLSEQEDFPHIPAEIPMKVIHVLSGNRAYKQSMLLKEFSQTWKEQKVNFNVLYMVPEKKPQIGIQTVQFFNKHEQDL